MIGLILFEYHIGSLKVLPRTSAHPFPFSYVTNWFVLNSCRISKFKHFIPSFRLNDTIFHHTAISNWTTHFSSCCNLSPITHAPWWKLWYPFLKILIVKSDGWVFYMRAIISWNMVFYNRVDMDDVILSRVATLRCHQVHQEHRHLAELERRSKKRKIWFWI